MKKLSMVLSTSMLIAIMAMGCGAKEADEAVAEEVVEEAAEEAVAEVAAVEEEVAEEAATETEESTDAEAEETEDGMTLEDYMKGNEDALANLIGTGDDALGIDVSYDKNTMILKINVGEEVPDDQIELMTEAMSKAMAEQSDTFTGAIKDIEKSANLTDVVIDFQYVDVNDKLFYETAFNNSGHIAE